MKEGSVEHEHCKDVLVAVLHEGPDFEKACSIFKRMREGRPKGLLTGDSVSQAKRLSEEYFSFLQEMARKSGFEGNPKDLMLQVTTTGSEINSVKVLRA